MSKDSRQLSIRTIYSSSMVDPLVNRGILIARNLESALELIDTPVSQPFESGLFTNSIGMKFRRIRAGSFTMGSPKGDLRPFLSETQHTTTLTQDFNMGCYLVTQSQFEKVMGFNPSGFRGNKQHLDSSSLPVESISWYHAHTFCLFLSSLPEEKEAGRVYRLPTEAQWEYACRAGSTSAYCYGDDSSMLDLYAWHGNNSSASTHPVGTKRPNAWGLYDMHGNVLEWCADWYAPYPNGTCSDPKGPATGYGRVFRGGSFDLCPQMCGSAFRSMNHPTYRMHNLGFRVAMCMD